MKIDLAEMLSELHRDKKTGLLSITVTNTNRLFKVFVRHGDIYRVAYAGAKGPACLATCDELEFGGFYFLPDIEVDATRDEIPPTPDLISFFRMTAKSIEAGRVEGGPAPNGGTPVRNYSLMLDQLKAALVDQIGPAGMKVFQRTVDENWRPHATPTRQDLERLVDLVKAFVDDPKDRQTFLMAAKKILSA